MANNKTLNFNLVKHYEDLSLEGSTIEALEAMGFVIEAIDDELIYVTL